MTDVVIVDSGVANLASIAGAFRRLGANVVVTGDESLVRDAHGVLPAWARSAPARSLARARGSTKPSHKRRRAAPRSWACASECRCCAKRAKSAGGGRARGHRRHLSPTADDVRVPHLGWNTVTAGRPGLSLRAWRRSRTHTPAGGPPGLASPPGRRTGPASWRALEKDGERLLACQFHPELSGAYGGALLERWLAGAKGAPAPALTGSTPGLLPRVVPCLDVRDGRVVKGCSSSISGSGGSGVSARIVRVLRARTRLCVLDVAASAEGRATQIETVARVRGGDPYSPHGRRRRPERDDARRLLAAGADKVSVNTAAVQRPALLSELAAEFGSQCVVLAIDARRTGNGWEALTHGVARRPTRRRGVGAGAAGLERGRSCSRVGTATDARRPDWSCCGRSRCGAGCRWSHRAGSASEPTWRRHFAPAQCRTRSVGVSRRRRHRRRHQGRSLPFAGIRVRR